jgi:hypothetical protein
MARSKSYRELVRDLSENRGRFLNLGELAVYRQLPLLRIRQLHELAEKDPRSDPWAGGNFTQAEKFDEWYWGRRIELEIGELTRENGENGEPQIGEAGKVSTKSSVRNKSLNSTKRHRNGG